MKLFHGDCREVMESEAYKKYVEGKNVIVVTDPPFNIGYKYGEYKDNMPNEEYMQMLVDICQNPAVVIHYPEALYKLAIEMKKAPERVVSWVYNTQLAKQHRDIAFWGIAPDFTRVLQPYKNPSDKRIRARIEGGVLGARLYDWWHIEQVKNVSKEKTEHPCQMPQMIMDNIIGVLPCDENTVIVDPFMGSGTTGIACKKLGVDFVGIEQSRKYYEICERRILAQTNVLDELATQLTLFNCDNHI